jgi:hypothetical protein
MKTPVTVGAALLAGAMLVVVSAAPAQATDTPISTAKMKVGDRTYTLRGKISRKVYFFSKDPAISIPAEGGLGDPLLNGGAVEVVNTSGTGEGTSIPLPAENWWRIPQDPQGGLRGWKYQENVEDQYKIFILFKHSAVGTQPLLKIKVRDRVGAVIAYTLDEPTQGSIGVRFFTGVDQHCADSAGALKKKDDSRSRDGRYSGRFTVKAAPAPRDCNLGSP